MSVVALVLAACVVPADQTPGWKVVRVAHDAPALLARAEVEVDQLRGGEPVLVTDRRPALVVSTRPAGWGVMRFEVRLPRGATAAQVAFVSKLGAAEVDVTALGASLEVPLVHHQRVASNVVDVSLPKRELNVLRVEVHHHFRPPPVLETATVTWRGVATAAELPNFVPPGWLAYRHPGGRTLQLCDAPGQTPRLTLDGPLEPLRLP